MKPNQRLRQARMAAGFKTAADAARALGIPQQTYYSHESGRNALSIDAAKRYAEIFRCSITSLIGEQFRDAGWQEKTLSTIRLVPIIGRVAAGMWLEAPPDVSAGTTPLLGEIPVVEHFGGAQHFALQVDGTSMNRVFQHGEYVIVQPWDSVGRDVKDGDLVVLQRERHGLYEVTLKRARMIGPTAQFWPESDDPRWHEPINAMVVDGETLCVIGLVTGRFAAIA